MRIFTPLIILFIVLFSLYVSADLEVGLEHYWTLNDTDFNDSIGSWDFGLGYTNINYTTGKNPSDSLVIYHDEFADRYYSLSSIDLNQTYTFNYWFNQSGSATGYIITYFETSDVFFHSSGTDYTFYWETCSFNVPLYTFNEWTMVTILSNSTGGSLYVNGIFNKSCSGGVKSSTNATYPIYFGDYGNENKWAFDEIGYWSLELSESDITELYNSGEGLFYPYYPITPPNVTINLVSPDNNTYTDEFNVEYCFNAVSNYDLDSCMFYTNYSGLFESNSTFYDVVNSSEYCLEWDSGTFGDFLWGFWCNTTSGGNFFSESRLINIVNETLTSCYYSVTPTLKNKIPYLSEGLIELFCEIPLKNASCFTSVIKDGETLQVNPEPKSVNMFGVIDSFVSRSTPTGSFVRVHFVKKNLVPENEFIFMMTCSDKFGSVVRYNKTFIPEYNQIKSLGSRMIWSIEMIPYFIGLTLIIIIGGSIWFLIKDR